MSTITNTAAPTAVTLPPAGTYRIDAGHSTVALTGRHMFGLGPVHATFSIDEGEIRITDPITSSTVRAVIPTRSFTSNSGQRDRHVRSKLLLDAATYPHITFNSDRLRRDGTALVVHGTATAHRRTVPVELMIASAETSGTTTRFHAHTRLDRYAFGISRVRGMVDRHVDLDLDICAERVG